MARKPVVSLEQFSKAELITLVKKLQKQVTKLQLASTARNTFLRDPEPADVVEHLENAALAEDEHLNPLTVNVFKPADEYLDGIQAKLPGIGPCKPAFPWEPK